jgi:hypothetical protein
VPLLQLSLKEEELEEEEEAELIGVCRGVIIGP